MRLSHPIADTGAGVLSRRRARKWPSSRQRQTESCVWHDGQVAGRRLHAASRTPAWGGGRGPMGRPDGACGRRIARYRGRILGGLPAITGREPMAGREGVMRFGDGTRERRETWRERQERPVTVAGSAPLLPWSRSLVPLAIWQFSSSYRTRSCPRGSKRRRSRPVLGTAIIRLARERPRRRGHGDPAFPSPSLQRGETRAGRGGRCPTGRSRQPIRPAV